MHPGDVDGVPDDVSFGSLPPDWDRMAPYVEQGHGQGAGVGRVGIRTFFCGPESFTPDLQPIVGEAPEVRNYFVAAGLNSIGILTGGGLGTRSPSGSSTVGPTVDVTGFNIDRFHAYQANPEYRAYSHRRVVRNGVSVSLSEPFDADGA